MGVLQQDPDAWFEGGVDAGVRTQIEALVAARLQARSDRNWAEADRIRSELADMGVEVMDGREGASWRFREEGR
jgi:cysteinyl-tRNA synthetase